MATKESIVQYLVMYVTNILLLRIKIISTFFSIKLPKYLLYAIPFLYDFDYLKYIKKLKLFEIPYSKKASITVKLIYTPSSWK